MFTNRMKMQGTLVPFTTNSGDVPAFPSTIAELDHMDLRQTTALAGGFGMMLPVSSEADGTQSANREAIPERGLGLLEALVPALPVPPSLLPFVGTRYVPPRDSQ